MPKISVSQYEFNHLVEEGIDLVAYFEGRFIEALNRGDLPTPVNIPLFLDGTKIAALESSVTYLETTHVANSEFDTLKREVDSLRNQITELKSDNEAIFKRLCELENATAKAATGASGRVYRVGDSVNISEMGIGKIVEVDPLDKNLPARVYFEDEGIGPLWVDDADFEGSF